MSTTTVPTATIEEHLDDLADLELDYYQEDEDAIAQQYTAARALLTTERDDLRLAFESDVRTGRYN